MATIGLSIESGAMHAVLVDASADTVVASRTTSLDGGEAEAFAAAVAEMRTVAAGSNTDVEAVGVVYRSDDERARFEAVLEKSELDAELVSASTAFLGWLASSSEFDSATCVLLYYMGATGVSISLADAHSASVSIPKTAALDSMSPERIGSTVALAWEVLDEAKRKPDAVALFGDGSANRDLVDILALGLGVPVVRVADSEQIAARGAALHAAGSVDPASTTVESTEEAAPTKKAVAAVALEKAVATKNAVALGKAVVPKKAALASTAAAAGIVASSRKADTPEKTVAGVKIVPTNNAVAKAAVVKPASAQKPATVPAEKDVKPVLTKAAPADPVATPSASTRPVPAKPVTVKPVPAKRVAPAAATPVASMAPAAAALPSVRPKASSATGVADVALATPSPRQRKKILFAAALLAGVLSGGVALATTLPSNAPAQTEARDVAAPESAGIDTSLTGATATVEVTPPAPAAAPTAAPLPPPVVIDPITQQPVIADPTSQQQWTIDPTTGVAKPTSEALRPIPAAAIPPAAAVVPPKTVEPPVFAVPPIIPEAGKSQEQLEQEAWDRHWAHTADWLHQEIAGN